jgi:hypothetical protein
MAIGHFIGTFVNDPFLSPEPGIIAMDLIASPGSHGWNAGVGVTEAETGSAFPRCFR